MGKFYLVLFSPATMLYCSFYTALISRESSICFKWRESVITFKAPCIQGLPHESDTPEWAAEFSR